MICRLSAEEGYTRINILSRGLNVKPSSASKMVETLKARGLARSEKYGCVEPSAAGLATGGFLLYRHALLDRFLCYINGSGDELDQVEKSSIILMSARYGIFTFLWKIPAAKGTRPCKLL